ncbi:MAG: leucine-rich repeat domain-containing protein [Ruminococcus flavefaciens]|nr:leucine-rich repeat domain-containing protein [Ruminococcus flavefaciens]
MEKFEINEHGSLTAYHNDNKDITEITVPNGVKHISFAVFKKYRNIHSVTLPDSLKYIEHNTFWNSSSPQGTSVHFMKYRGVIFNPAIDSFHMENVIDMIYKKDYSYVLSHKLKYPIILQIYFNDSDDITTAYIKKNFKKFFIFLSEKEDYNTLEKLIKSGKFISKRNIETYIKIADEKECYSVFDMLIEYKETVLDNGKI